MSIWHSFFYPLEVLWNLLRKVTYRFWLSQADGADKTRHFKYRNDTS